LSSKKKESLLAATFGFFLRQKDNFGASFMKIFVILRNEESLPIEQLVWIIPAEDFGAKYYENICHSEERKITNY
jgi:hypothetical protein